ncbi:hypothetical protein ALTERO38_60894 [Alteromonas sp. 38]|nr:hypothetical protein ALTERO38_60894 [Alteromonas sp. 38]
MEPCCANQKPSLNPKKWILFSTSTNKMPAPNDTANQTTKSLARRDKFSFQYAFLSSSFLNAIVPSSCQVNQLFYFYIFLTPGFANIIAKLSRSDQLALDRQKSST